MSRDELIQNAAFNLTAVIQETDPKPDELFAILESEMRKLIRAELAHWIGIRICSNFFNHLHTSLRGYMQSVLDRAHPYGEMLVDDNLLTTIPEARRSAISNLLDAEARRQAEREAEAAFWRSLDERGDCN